MMKKKVLSMALAAIALVSFNGMAQTTKTNDTNVAKKECVDGKKCCKDADKSCKDGKFGKGNRPCKDSKFGKDNRPGKDGKFGKNSKGVKGNPYEGLNLTEAQKSQLQQLDSKRKAARKQQSQAKKETKQRNDSARMAERRANKKAYLEEIKAIVGPENYVVFLENMYMNGGGNHHGKKAAFNHKHGDKAKGMHKGERRGNRDRHQASNHNKENANISGANS